MKNRIMVKMTASEDWIIFKTVTKARKSSGLYVRRDKLLSLADCGQFIAWDHSFAVFTCSKETATVNIRFYWLNMNGEGHLDGRIQNVKLPLKPFMDFIEQSAYKEQRKEWSVLSIEPQTLPKLVFRSRNNLYDVISDKLARRKLSKFLRDNFHWSDSTEIIFTDDFVPKSFYFREMRGDTAGICGGMILHGQENMEKAYYETHT